MSLQELLTRGGFVLKVNKSGDRYEIIIPPIVNGKNKRDKAVFSLYIEGDCLYATGPGVSRKICGEYYSLNLAILYFINLKAIKYGLTNGVVVYDNNVQQTNISLKEIMNITDEADPRYQKFIDMLNNAEISENYILENNLQDVLDVFSNFFEEND